MDEKIIVRRKIRRIIRRMKKRKAVEKDEISNEACAYA